jgi:hexokinase
MFMISNFSRFQFHLMLSEDGSGKGAALVAAVANRLKPS